MTKKEFEDMVQTERSVIISDASVSKLSEISECDYEKTVRLK